MGSTPLNYPDDRNADGYEEMSLADYVGVLPAGHRAQGELDRLLRIAAKAKELAAMMGADECAGK